jgi:protein O-GlcNAc transferase
MLKWLKAVLPQSSTDSSAKAEESGPDDNARGRAFLQQGDWEQAVACFRRVVATSTDVDAHINLGFALYRREQYREAWSTLQHALTLDPASADAHYMLALVARSQWNTPAAIEHYEAALALKPDIDQGWVDLSFLLYQDGQLERTRDTVVKGLQYDSQSHELHFFLGNLQANDGQHTEAIESYRKALAIQPDYPEAHYNLAIAFRQTGELEQAADHYRRFLASKPDDAQVHADLGAVLESQGLLAEAADSFRNAVRLKPESSGFHLGLGFVQHQMRDINGAIASYAYALAISPGDAIIHNNLGNALQMQGRIKAAVASYRQALDSDPDYADAESNLASALLVQGQLQKALRQYRDTLARYPGLSEVHSNLLFAMNFEATTHVAYLEEARKFGARVSARARPYTSWKTPTLEAGTPLRVGMVSGDFNSHPVAFFLESVVARLDPKKIQLFAYPTQGREDETSTRLKSHFHSWSPIVGVPDEAAAQRISNDGIHVLVDLAGHSAYNRLPLFAWKPAPVQVCWLGYVASTGVPGMDYMLADPVSVPQSDHAQFTEKVWYLPETRICFTPPLEYNLPVAPQPALRKGHITFGCFQTLPKLSDATLAAWSRILDALPEAHLQLQCKQMSDPEIRRDVELRLAAAGIGEQRLTLIGEVSRQEFLRLHDEVDIILDTFPIPGGTTTCDALWMGVPTVTLCGATMFARQGASLLACVGLQDWIAQDQDDYVARALTKAQDVEGLARLRAGLREQALASPLFDAERFARHLEQALHAMWEAATSRAESQHA